MTNPRLTKVIALIVATLLGGALAGTPVSAGARHIAHYNADPDLVIDTIGSLDATIVAHFDAIGLVIVESDTANLDDLLESTGLFDYAVEDREVQWLDDLEIGEAVDASGAGEALEPSDAGEPEDALWYRLGRQWGLELSRADLAWQITKGDPGVAVAVLDTGICQHQWDMIGKVDEEYSISFVEELSDCGTSQPPPECPDCPAWEDYRFHGTHVAGIISSNNRWTAGVAPRVRLRAVKVLRCNGRGPYGAIIQGIMYAVDTNNDVINMSLSGAFLKSSSGRSHWKLVDAVGRAVNYAQRRGVLVVSAAGNAAIDLDHDADYTVLPCQSGSGMCVGATTSMDELASFSNHGMSGPQITAPGGGDPGKSTSTADRFVWAPCSAHSAIYPACSPGTFVLAIRGTSMAAPHVAGAAALVDSVAVAGPGSLRSGRIETTLLNAADDLGSPGADDVFSRGRLNVRRAVE